ncbi:MAG TPA: glutathione S-transferase [Burkholderiales bacterium]|jgi:glutathione S-transferase
MYRLHCFCQSGNSYKVALALRCMNQPWTAVFVDFMNGATRTEEWRRELNEMGEVPILEDGELRLTQSGMILSYLANKHRQFGGADDAERREILRWLLFDNHKFSSYFVSYRFMKSFAPAAPDAAVMAWLKGRIDQVFAIAERHLESRRFVVGDAPTIADFSMCGYLFFPEEESGLRLAQRFAAIARWLERIRALPGWADPYDILPGERLSPRW